MRCIGGMLVVALAAVSPGTAASDDELSVLFIGNSLTLWNDMPEMLRWMCVEAGIEVGRIETVAYPNFGLEDHWRSDVTRALIAEGGWDFVVMQQGPSATEGRPSLIEYVQRFAPLIREVGATPAVFMVWPAAARDFDFDGVVDAHTTAAEKANALLLPAGVAWRAAWRRNPELNLYGKDRFHPSALGSYLVALVVFDRLTAVDLSSLPAAVPTPEGAAPIPDDVAELLRAAVADASAPETP